MRRSVLALAVLLFVAGTTAGAQNGADDRETLKRLSVEWMEAVARKDRPALERLLAPDFQLLSIGDLQGVNRSEWLANALRMDWENRGYSNVQVDINDDIGIVTSNYAFEVDPGEWKPSIAAASPVVDVWVRRGGRWQVQRRHLGGSTITRWLDRALGFVFAAAVFGIFVLLRRLVRSRRAAARDPALRQT